MKARLITAVRALPGTRLQITWDSGVEVVVDLKKELKRSGALTSLADTRRFNTTGPGSVSTVARFAIGEPGLSAPNEEWPRLRCAEPGYALKLPIEERIRVPQSRNADGCIQRPTTGIVKNENRPASPQLHLARRAA